MYRLHVTGPTGVEAEFTVGSATLALDLALRSVRAGMAWTVEHLAPGREQRLTLSALRQCPETGAEVARGRRQSEVGAVDERGERRPVEEAELGRAPPSLLELSCSALTRRDAAEQS